MQQIAHSMTRIFHMSSEEIVDLHYKIKRKAFAHYEQGYNQNNLDSAIWLSEKAVEISSLVIAAMKAKHKQECDEYQRIMGMPHPSTKFYYPKHHAAEKLITVFERQGKILQAEHIANKIAAEGWGSDKYIELSDL